MKSLLKVNKALKEAVPKLPEAESISDVAYLVDVTPTGADSLVVYVVLKNKKPVTTASKRKVESRLRDALRTALDYDVYFRWRTAEEQKEVVTMGGLIDRPVSALR